MPTQTNGPPATPCVEYYSFGRHLHGNTFTSAGTAA